ncbi:MAG: aminoacyl-tRNA hydrolase [Planctomycetaceae bacterium]|nr:aminoacyl-tRNA hydrolase [Planctomycetaceae bacterium]
MEDIVVNPALVIPANCLRLAFSRSGGPGGQNVNKLNTRVSLSLDIPACPALSDEQKQRLLKVLKNRIDKLGVLTISSQEHRSQHANRVEAANLMADLLRQTLKPPKPRKKTRIPKSAVEKRLEAKKRRSAIKQLRSQQVD